MVASDRQRKTKSRIQGKINLGYGDKSLGMLLIRKIQRDFTEFLVTSDESVSCLYQNKYITSKTKSVFATKSVKVSFEG